MSNITRQVLSLVGEGKTDKEIAQALKIDETTTQAEIRSILRILGVHTERPSPLDREVPASARPYLRAEHERGLRPRGGEGRKSYADHPSFGTTR